MDGGEEGSDVFGVAGRDAAPAFELEESVLDKMPQLVQILVIWPWYRAVFLRRDDHVHALALRLFKDRVGVVTLIGQKMPGAQSFDQTASLRAISRGTLRNNPDLASRRGFPNSELQKKPSKRYYKLPRVLLRWAVKLLR